MAALAKMVNETVQWLNGKRMGAPLGMDNDKSKEVALGTRLNELSLLATGSVAIAAAAFTGTVSFGADFALAKCVGSIKSDTGGLAVLATVSDCDAAGDCTVTLSTAPGGADIATVNVWADGR